MTYIFRTPFLVFGWRSYGDYQMVEVNGLMDFTLRTYYVCIGVRICMRSRHTSGTLNLKHITDTDTTSINDILGRII